MNFPGEIRVLVLFQEKEQTRFSHGMWNSGRYAGHLSVSSHHLLDHESAPKILELLGSQQPHVVLCSSHLGRCAILCSFCNSLGVTAVEFDLHSGADLGDFAFLTYVASDLKQRLSKGPLVSVLTPAFNASEFIERAWLSLQRQNYPFWEWIVYDDSEDGGKTAAKVLEISKGDPRVFLFKGGRRSGAIGHTKALCARLARGRVFVELDHDDELMPLALSLVVEGFDAHPQCGFLYSDWFETWESGKPHVYAEGWGLGLGRTQKVELSGTRLAWHQTPPLLGRTIRYINACPNHLRAWTRSAYEEAGGFDESRYVCEDYDLLLRSFLKTRFLHIPLPLYAQFRMDRGNTQSERNKHIHAFASAACRLKDKDIHHRVLELGGTDDLWNEELRRSDSFKLDTEASVMKLNFEFDVQASSAAKSYLELLSAPQSSQGSQGSQG